MNYNSFKIRDVMLQITQNEIYLPAIQRKFVWGPERIEKLFDSVMRGYPIGTFLFWFVVGATKDDYTFYKFIQNYHERDRALNEVAPKPDLRDKFIGVLDGQQRLNSMYVALQGSYSYRRKHGRWQDDSAFPQRFLYLNLFHHPSDEDEGGMAFEFRFLTPDSAKAVDANQYWFLVKDALGWSTPGPVFGVIDKAVKAFPQFKEMFEQNCGPMLNDLWRKLCDEDVINYFSIHEQELDKVVDIFVRVNSAGLQLSKTDLLFSSIVAHWDEGRSKIEALITTMNAKGNRFVFDNDFVMRACLALVDLPVLFKVHSFKKENIERISKNWPAIQVAMEATVDLLVEWGFSGETLSTLNAVVPIAYFAYKGGDISASKDDLRQYLIRALLNQIFASKTDRVLGAIRDHLRVPIGDGVDKKFALRSTRFTLTDMLTAKLPDGRTLAIKAEDIEDFLEQVKGPYTFMILSLLYPQLKFHQVQFHQDHIHPASQFSPAKLKDLGLDEEKIERWRQYRDQLPNLQLMEGALNQSKNATPFVTWIETQGANKAHFLNANFIPKDVSMELKDFEHFLQSRRTLLKSKLTTMLT
jgi:hypothetical protein